MPITTDVVSSNLDQGEVNLIKIRYTHLLPIFYRFFFGRRVWQKKPRYKIRNKCVDLILIRLGWGVQHYVIKFVSDLRHVGDFSMYSDFPHQWNWSPRYNWSLLKVALNTIILTVTNMWMPMCNMFIYSVQLQIVESVR